MDSCTNNGIRAHALKEAFKTEALTRCIDIFERSNRKLTEEDKEFLMDIMGERVDEFDVTKTYDLDCYSFHFPVEDSDEEEEVLFVKSEDITDVFVDFKQKLTNAILQLVMYDLELFLAGKEL